MTTPPHMKFVIRGKFLNTPEEWSYSLKFSRNFPAVDDADPTDITELEVRNALMAFHNTSMFNNSTKVMEWRAYVIGEDGKMQGNPRREDFIGTLNCVGTSGTRMPTDTALVVTMEAENRGPARLNRCYLPGPGFQLGTDHRISLADSAIALTNVTAYFKALADSIDAPGWTLPGASMLNISSVGAGARQTVKKLRIGRVYDHVERRRRQMLEDYQYTGPIDW